MNLVHNIIRILESDHEVILPSFGKFQLIFNSAILDNATKKVSPPYYSLLFSQQYNLNNESIFEKIAKSESLEENTIKEEYTSILSQWKSTLKTENILSLEHLGTFTADKEKITFEIADNCVFNFKNFGLPAI